MSREKVTKGVASFYDRDSKGWEKVLGDHIHYGFYDPNSKPSSLNDIRVAQVRMIEEALRFGGLDDNSDKKPKYVVDVGCGLGGTSRYMAKKYGATCQGITLSPKQAERAQALAKAEGLGQDKVNFQVADALEQPFADGTFDFVWSMECAEHVIDKQKFLSELVRVAAPGATIVIVTQCHRDLSRSEESLKPEEQKLLDKLSDAYYLPTWCSAAHHVKMLQSLPVEDIKVADWSKYVEPFLPALIRSSMSWKGLKAVMRSGWKTMKRVTVIPVMNKGFKTGLVRFAIITCRKPLN
ncbi:unnamed protein product [Amaranthus hypochondriacus]